MKQLAAIGMGVLLGLTFIFIESEYFTEESDPRVQVIAEQKSRAASAANQITENPDQLENYIEAAYTYLQLQRETQSPLWYTRADEVVNEAQSRFEANAELHALAGQVALGQHRFSDARDMALKAVALQPATARYYGVLGDALLELGEYEKATDAYQTMVNLRPNYGAYVRIAYLRELYGDQRGALLALDEAEAAGAPFSENIAWLYTERGRLLRDENLASSTQAYEAALQLVPGYVVARAGLAHNQYWQGDTEAALVTAELLYQENPTATHATLLGDLLFLTGEVERAERLYVVAEISFEQAERGGQNVDKDLADFKVVRGRSDADARTRAERYYQEHATVAAAVTYARTLLAVGQTDMARRIILPLQTDEVGQYDPLVWFVAAEIATRDGDILKAESYYKRAVEEGRYPNLRDATILSNY